MTIECLRCGACCRSLIVEAELLDALREPRIAEVCGLPVPPPDACVVDEDEQPVGEDPWNGRAAILSPRRDQDGQLAGAFSGCDKPLHDLSYPAERLRGICPRQ